MLAMVILGVGLRFIQELRAGDAADKLKAMIRVTATVLRDGQPRELPLGHLVPGDVVQLAAGDMIPADLRLVSCKDLFVIQSSLTGESLPVEKFDAKEEVGGRPALELLRAAAALGTPFPLVLVDCHMPEMDGFEATALIRNEGGRGREIPIVATTAHNGTAERDRCLASGMTDFVSKPLSSAALQRVLDVYLRGVVPHGASQRAD